MSDVRATVAICTRNRAVALRRALESVCALELPPDTSWEVVLVDNMSSDDTQNVIASFRARLPLRDFVEPSLGIAAGRNRVVAEARGDYILWIDDDAIVSPPWLAAYLEAFDRFPHAAVLGGPIRVAFDGPVPDWFSRVLPLTRDIYAHRDLSPEPIVLPASDDMLPFGTNYVTRTSDQRRFVYDTRLGRHPEHPGRGCEETELMLTMLQSGLEGRWVPGATVTHLKSVDRANLAFIAQHCASYGAYRAVRYGVPGRRIFGAPVGAWRRVVRVAYRYAWRRLVRPPEQWIVQFRELHEAIGSIRGLRMASFGL